MAGGGSSPVMSRTVEYQFILADNVVPVALGAKNASDALAQSVAGTTDEINRQNISYIKAVASLGAFRHGLRSLAMGMEDLGLVNKKTNESFFKLISVVDMFTGVALGVKGLIGMFQLLAKAELGVAIVETYRKILANPSMAAVAMGAGIAATAVGAYMVGYNQGLAGGQGEQSWEARNPSITQNISFQGGPDSGSRYASRSALEGVY